MSFCNWYLESLIKGAKPLFLKCMQKLFLESGFIILHSTQMFNIQLSKQIISI